MHGFSPSTEHALRELQGRGRYVFTPAELATMTGRDPRGPAITRALSRLSADGRIVNALKRPSRWLIVPPEHAHFGAPPVALWLDDCLRDTEPFYYLGLQSAARHWGSAHYARQTTQVMVAKARRSSSAGKLRIEYTVKANLERTPVVMANAQGGRVRVSTREATLLDLVRHQDAVGGLEAIARIAHDFRQDLDPAALLVALDALNQLPAAQRLGFILEAQGQDEYAAKVEEWLSIRRGKRSLLTVPIQIGESLQDGVTRSRRWAVSYSPNQQDELAEAR